MAIIYFTCLMGQDPLNPIFRFRPLNFQDFDAFHTVDANLLQFWPNKMSNIDLYERRDCQSEVL